MNFEETPQPASPAIALANQEALANAQTLGSLSIFGWALLGSSLLVVCLPMSRLVRLRRLATSQLHAWPAVCGELAEAAVSVAPATIAKLAEAREQWLRHR
jgi:hypothetical protein